MNDNEEKKINNNFYLKKIRQHVEGTLLAYKTKYTAKSNESGINYVSP